MIQVESFAETINSIRLHFDNYSFPYNGGNFRQVVNVFFMGLPANIANGYGVYTVRNALNDKVLYIGKAGTVNNQGIFKGQNLRGRLLNTRDWTFNDLHVEQGSLLIEVVFVRQENSPQLIETYLLQAFLNEFQLLPLRNNCL